MITLAHPYCGFEADDNRLARGHEQSFGYSEPGPLAEAFNMWRFKDGQFIDDSVAAGVAH